jgi:hypothetical protein
MLAGSPNLTREGPLEVLSAYCFALRRPLGSVENGPRSGLILRGSFDSKTYARTIGVIVYGSRCVRVCKSVPSAFVTECEQISRPRPVKWAPDALKVQNTGKTVWAWQPRRIIRRL